MMVSKISITILFLLLVGAFNPYQKAWAQSSTRVSQSRVNSTIQFDPPPPPETGEPPGRAQGGGNRGDCLTALVPETKTKAGTLLWGVTVADRPTLWLSLAKGSNANVSGQWILRDDKGNLIYRSTFTVPKIPPGIISLSMPATAAPLQIGKTYRWSISIDNCDPDVIDAPETIRGAIQRIVPPADLQRQLTAAKTPLERATLYADRGIWHDALTTLGTQIRTDQPKKSEVTAWGDLLREVNLGRLTSAPVTQCCTLDR